MSRNHFKCIYLLLVILILGGCSLLNESKQNNEKDNTNADDVYVPVQEYTGEEYALPNGKKTGKIANENRDVIEKAIKEFFIEEYKTEVKVHNIVGNVDGATVFVESIGEPHFYTYAIIPIDKKSETIITDAIWTQEGAVEDAIMTGIYVLGEEEKFQNLTNYLKDFSQENGLTGLNKKAVTAGARRFSNEFYFISIRDDAPFQNVLELYFEDSNRTREEWQSIFELEAISPLSIMIVINLYMANKDDEPDEAIFNTLLKDIEKLENIPKGYYSIALHDNYIHKTRAIGNKENSLKRDTLLKE